MDPERTFFTCSAFCRMARRLRIDLFSLHG
jgi:hypothetical protein